MLMYFQIELQVNGTISFFVYHLYFPHSIKIIQCCLVNRLQAAGGDCPHAENNSMPLRR